MCSTKSLKCKPGGYTKICWVMPQSTCASCAVLPSIVTVKRAGGKPPGTDADANIICRINCAEYGFPLSAMRPISQIIGRCASILVVPINNKRPLRLSAAMRATTSGVTTSFNKCSNGAVLANASPPKMPLKIRGVAICRV